MEDKAPRTDVNATESGEFPTEFDNELYTASTEIAGDEGETSELKALRSSATSEWDLSRGPVLNGRESENESPSITDVDMGGESSRENHHQTVVSNEMFSGTVSKYLCSQDEEQCGKSTSGFREVVINPLARTLTPLSTGFSMLASSLGAKRSLKPPGSNVCNATWRTILDSQSTIGLTKNGRKTLELTDHGTPVGALDRQDMKGDEAERVKELVASYGIQLCDHIRTLSNQSPNHKDESRSLGRIAAKLRIFLDEIKTCNAAEFSSRSLDGLASLQYALEMMHEMLSTLSSMGSLHAILVSEQINARTQTIRGILRQALIALNVKDLPVHQDTADLIRFVYKQVNGVYAGGDQKMLKIASEFRRRTLWMKRNDAEVTDIRHTVRILIESLEKRGIVWCGKDKHAQIKQDIEDCRKEIATQQVAGSEQTLFLFEQVLSVLETLLEERMEFGGLVCDDKLSLTDKRRRRIVVPVIAFLCLFTCVLVMVLWGARIVVATLKDGNWLRLVHVASFPVVLVLMMFGVLFLFNSIFFALGPVAHMEENSYYYSSKPVHLQSIPRLPKVTLQMPVYKEDLDFVIKPTLQSLKAAAEKYRQSGGSYNIFVNDDGLQLVTDGEREARERCYDAMGVAYVARPGHGKDGFVRRGRFKKASNMNFCLDISERVRKLMEQESYGPKEALGLIKNDDQTFLGGGDVSMGDFVLLIDSDTRVPEDCILPTVLELLASPKVAFTQHMTTPLQVVHDYWEDAIAHFTTSIYTIAVRIASSAGDVPPLVGHNAFLRWSAIKEVAFKDPTDCGKRKYWSESHVSEDFDLALRFQVHGYYGRYVTYTGYGFQEGVSLTVHDEIIRFRKYAYGASELVFNPMLHWCVKGPFASMYLQYMFSGTPWPSKIQLTAYLGSYFAISMAWISAVANLFLFAYSSYWRSEVIKSIDIIYTIIFIFGIVGPTGVAILRYRLNLNSFLKALLLEFRHVIVFTIFFNGLSYHIWTAIMCHLCGINVNFGITSKEIRKTNFFKEIAYTVTVYKDCYLLMVFFSGMIAAFYFFVPDNFKIRDMRAIVPLLVVIVGHIITPVFLNPVLMRVKF